MLRLRYLVLVLAVLAAAPSRLPAETRLAPFYSLPADGTWVEYEWTRRMPNDRTEKGTLRISSVGHTMVAGQACRWAEIQVATGKGKRARWQRRKLLIAERPFQEGRPLQDCLLECYHQDDLTRAVRRFPRSRVNSFLGMGLEEPRSALRVVNAREKVECPFTTCLARHLVLVSTTGDQQWQYHVSLTREVPFGWVKLEIHEQRGAAPVRLLFTATASKTGQGAKSEVDESASR